MPKRVRHSNGRPSKYKNELNKLLDMEETMWQQRSRINWLKSGDRNTSFFHTKASGKFQRNTILGVMDGIRVCRDEVEEIGSTFVGYFKKLFSTSNLEVKEELIGAIHRKVSDQTNFLLTRDFRVDEVERALKQMFPTTTPSPDGMPPLFYQKFWLAVRAIVFKTILDFLNLGITP